MCDVDVFADILVSVPPDGGSVDHDQGCDSEMLHYIILVSKVLIFSADSDNICLDITIKRANGMCADMKLTFIGVCYGCERTFL